MSEVLHEMLVEVSGDPVKFAIELVQFALLMGVVYFVAFGFGRRAGMVRNMLAERRDRVAQRVERATDVAASKVRAREDADRVIAEAKREAASILKQARATAHGASAQARALADQEAAEIRARARQVLDDERSSMRVEERDRLIAVVAQATRSLLNESLTPHEQRQLIQGIVSEQVDRLSASDEQRPASAVP